MATPRGQSRSLCIERSYLHQQKPGCYTWASGKAGITYPRHGSRAPCSGFCSRWTISCSPANCPNWSVWQQRTKASSFSRYVAGIQIHDVSRANPMKYYLNSSAEQLEQVPEWLRPSLTQATTAHPIAIDFFAWPTLRDRLVSQHKSIFRTSALSHVYKSFIKFDWPFAFEDAFFHDEVTGQHRPNPLFERYHSDLRRWSVTEEFYAKFPEMRTDIEGDRRRFAEDLGV